MRSARLSQQSAQTVTMAEGG